MEILIVARRGRDPCSSPSHLLLDFLRALCVLLQVCLPELWLPLLAGYYYTRWNTYRDPRDQSCTRRPRTRVW